MSGHGGLVVVIGDLIVDDYVDVRFFSGIAEWQSHRFELGGAALVEANVKELLRPSMVLGVVGSDTPGHWMRGKLPSVGAIIDPSRPTTVNTHFRHDVTHVELFRMDRVQRHRVDESIEKRITDNFPLILSYGVSVLVLADYGHGIVGSVLASRLIKMATDAGVHVVVDTRRGVLFGGQLVTVLSESQLDSQRVFYDRTPADLSAGYRTTIVQLSDDGTSVIHWASRDATRVDRHQLEPGELACVDPSGSREVFVASLSYGLAVKLNLIDAVDVATRLYAKSLTKPGPALVQREDFRK